MGVHVGGIFYLTSSGADIHVFVSLIFLRICWRSEGVDVV